MLASLLPQDQFPVPKPSSIRAIIPKPTAAGGIAQLNDTGDSAPASGKASRATKPSKIAIVTGAFRSTPDYSRPDYLEIAFENQRMYAALHGYESITLDVSAPQLGNRGHTQDTERMSHDHICTVTASGGAYRAKLEAIFNLLTDPDMDLEWVVWKDADTLFMDCEKRLEDFIAENPDKDAILTSDVTAWFFNSGVMMWRQSAFSRNFLQSVIDLMKVMPPPRHGLNGEQVYLNYQSLPREDQKRCREDFRPCGRLCNGSECLEYLDRSVSSHFAILPNAQLQTLRKDRVIPPSTPRPVHCDCLPKEDVLVQDTTKAQVEKIREEREAVTKRVNAAAESRSSGGIMASDDDDGEEEQLWGTPPYLDVATGDAGMAYPPGLNRIQRREFDLKRNENFYVDILPGRRMRAMGKRKERAIAPSFASEGEGVFILHVAGASPDVWAVDPKREITEVKKNTKPPRRRIMEEHAGTSTCVALARCRSFCRAQKQFAISE
mmetsp:Transcript_36908/g.105730  ORF Transcript_36908/g.105730 Transcript_36908/m.105730 type:complete len:493 (+) Transcript_36908:1293-2771(+)